MRVFVCSALLAGAFHAISTFVSAETRRALCAPCETIFLAFDLHAAVKKNRLYFAGGAPVSLLSSFCTISYSAVITFLNSAPGI